MKRLLVISALFGTLIIAGPHPQASAQGPPRFAKAIPAQVAHKRQRGRYLARACAPLDYWHVICPERWHP